MPPAPGRSVPLKPQTAFGICGSRSIVSVPYHQHGVTESETPTFESRNLFAHIAAL